MLWWFAQTSLIAGALAVVATLAGRWRRLGPEARHALWLLVLIKLAIPPFIAWPWSVPDAWPAAARVEPAPVSVTPPMAIPDPPVAPVAILSPDASSTPSPDRPSEAGAPPSPEEVLAGVGVAEEAPISSTPDPRPVEPPPRIIEPASAPQAQIPEISNRKSSVWNWQSALLAAWLTGSVVVVARRGFKVFRFHRSLADSRPAPDWLVDETRAIGDRVGVRPPPVLATPRVATPLLWCLGRPRLILPEALIKRLGVDRWPGILAHELAHLARGDHWVVRLELLVEAAWWWNPLFWIARRRLHEEAEIACDARVVRSLPERRHAYAEALVDVCEHIARSANPSPALGVGGAGAVHSLEGRLHMILRDPIPRGPSRRAAVLAVILAALALPAWSPGQQPKPEPTATQPVAPPSKPEAPPSPKPDAPPPKPDTPPSAAVPPMVPFATPLTIESIAAAQAKAREGLGNLSFRYIVEGRNESRNPARNLGGGPGGGGPGGPGGGRGGRADQTALPMPRSQAVHVQVADVVLGAGTSRLDVIEARRAPEVVPPPGDRARPLAWDRRFVAHNGEGYLALAMAWDQSGPVPFRWLGGAAGRADSFGDSLTSALFNAGRFPTGMDKGLEPLDPRPRNVLDLNLAGPGLPFLNTNNARADVVGLDSMDGRQVVRVAWIANADIGLRGLLWLAPELGFAVVRSDATQDPNQFGNARRSWRKRSSDFVKLANLWLPRKVTYEETQADPSGGEPARRQEKVMTFEDYQVAPTLPAETFRPKLAIQALDDLSGNFTAQPPEIPVGLVDRLKKAVLESKFGPPGIERTAEEPKAVAASSGTPSRPGQPGPNPRPEASAAPPNTANRVYEDIVANVDLPPPGRLMFKDGEADPAKAAPKVIAPTAPGLADPTPADAPKVAAPISPGGPADRAEIDRAIDRRFKLDPEVIELAGQISQASRRLLDVQRIATIKEDPALGNARKKLDDLNSKYQQLWKEKLGEIRADVASELARTRDEIEVLQARRAGKAAEVQKAEARLRGANLELANTKALRERAAVSEKEVERFKTNVEFAEAEVAGRKADLAEADALLNQAKRRLEDLAPSGRAPDPLSSKSPRPPVAEDSKDARDEIERRQAHRDTKAAELRKAEIALDQARLDQERAKTLLARSAIGTEEWERFLTLFKLAEAEMASRKADLAEADVLLDQAKRRPATRPVTPAGAATSGDRPSTLAELRDAVELMEVRLQGKQAELRGVEAKFDSARAILEARRPLIADGRVTKVVALESETNLKMAQAELEAKKAEVLESEVRIKQARRRLDLDEARLRREVDRARARLDHSEGLFEKRFVSKATYDADKSAHDELMIQLDPKFVPAPPASPPDTGEAPREPSAKPQAMLRPATDYFSFFVGAFW